jgi:methylsterol monooxygenase/4-alpha-methyl-delta7-sterol-4alpha-methyl oxidase
LKDSISLLLFNKLVAGPLFSIAVGVSTGWQISMNTEESQIPGPFRIAMHIVFGMMVEDFVFHIMHKVHHIKILYPYMHKVHHKYNESVSWATEYEHPIAYVTTTVLATSAHLVFLTPNMHLAEILCWVWIRTFEGLEGHCGYEFPFSPFRMLPFTSPP